MVKINKNALTRAEIAGYFSRTRSGNERFTPFHRKDGSAFSDVDYMEMLGRKCIEADAVNNTRLPTFYGDEYDPTVCAVAKMIVKALDEGYTRAECATYLCRCIDVNS